MHYFLFGKGVISEFSYSLDNREDTNLTLPAYGAMVAYSVWNWDVVGSSPTTQTNAGLAQLAEAGVLNAPKYEFKSHDLYQRIVEGNWYTFLS